MITDCRVFKMDPTDERYPDHDSIKLPNGSVEPFSAVYVCQCKLDDGQELEASFYLTPNNGDACGNMTAQQAGVMLRQFAGAVSRVTSKAA